MDTKKTRAFALTQFQAVIAMNTGVDYRGPAINITGPSVVSIFGREALEQLRDAIDFALGEEWPAEIPGDAS